MILKKYQFVILCNFSAIRSNINKEIEKIKCVKYQLDKI